MRTVKILALNMSFLCLDSVINLMRCFPCLEKLYMKVINSVHSCAILIDWLFSCFDLLLIFFFQSCTAASHKNLWRRKHRDFVKCSDIRLKTLVLENYRGIRWQVNFVTFFVLNASVLEVMRLEVASKDYNEAFLAQERKELQLEKAASRGALFEFTTHTCRHCASHVKHVRDLDITNPYECKGWSLVWSVEDLLLPIKFHMLSKLE